MARKKFEAATPVTRFHWRVHRMSAGAASVCYRIDPKTGAKTIFVRDELPTAAEPGAPDPLPPEMSGIFDS
jgi:hypothetical protein